MPPPARSVGLVSAQDVSTAALTAHIIDAQIDDVERAYEARKEGANSRVSVFGVGVGGDMQKDERVFDNVMTPWIRQLAASIKAAEL